MTDLDLSGLRYRIDKVPHGTDLIVHFRELADIPAFTKYKQADRNYLIRYIMLVYDPGTPLTKKYTDLRKRKEAAADYAGYDRDPKSGKFKNKNVYKVMDMLDSIEADAEAKIEHYESANPLIFAWLKHVNDMLWSEIMINEELFFEYTGLMLEAIEGKDSKVILDAAALKTKLRPELSIIRTHIKALYKEFFGETDGALIISTKAERIKPETVFKTLKVS